MAHNHERTRRRLRRGGLAAIIVVLGVGVWQGVAGATATGGKSAKIERHNENCGVSIGTPSIGTARLQQSGDTVFVKFNLENGNPNDEYAITLWVIKPGQTDCKQVGDTLGFINTDGSGRGHGDFQATVETKSAKYFATGRSDDDDFYNDSLIVTLKA